MGAELTPASSQPPLQTLPYGMCGLFSVRPPLPLLTLPSPAATYSSAPSAHTTWRPHHTTACRQVDTLPCPRCGGGGTHADGSLVQPLPEDLAHGAQRVELHRCGRPGCGGSVRFPRYNNPGARRPCRTGGGVRMVAESGTGRCVECMKRRRHEAGPGWLCRAFATTAGHGTGHGARGGGPRAS